LRVDQGFQVYDPDLSYQTMVKRLALDPKGSEECEETVMGIRNRGLLFSAASATKRTPIDIR
jgi:hypothetical protein